MLAYRLARVCALLLLGAILGACATVGGSQSSGAPSLRCVDQPGRGENYSPDRPMIFLFCAQSP